MSFKHSLNFIVEENETSPDGRMTLPALANRIELVAVEHAAKLNLSVGRLVNHGLAWVLAKMFIKIERMPEKYDNAIIYTWPVSINRLQFRRDFELADNTGAIIARATSQYVIIDYKTRKIVRIPEFVNHSTLTNDVEAVREPSWKLKAQENSPELYSTVAAADDIDINNHVNNVRYVKWVYEAMPDDIKEKIRTFSVLYKSEAFLDDEIIAKGSFNNGNAGVSLYRNADDAELVRSEAEWR